MAEWREDGPMRGAACGGDRVQRGTGRTGPGRRRDRLSLVLFWAAACPGAMPVPLRYLGGVRRIVRPRRARCVHCAAPHVLLPADTLPRHADTVHVVVAALLASHAGTGARTIAADLGVPVDTVRSWLRRVTGRADAVQTQATRWGHRYDPELLRTPTTGSVLGDVVSALGVAARAIRLRSETTATSVAAHRHYHWWAARVAAPHAQRLSSTPVGVQPCPHARETMTMNQANPTPSCSPRVTPGAATDH
jgi:hypothetical protein